MARTSTSVERNTFIRGLVTEAGPLTFPENASKDEINFILNKDGSRQRRLGMNYEDNYQLTSTGYSDDVVNSTRIAAYRWENVGNNSRKTLGVIKVANKLWFIDLDTTNPSANVLNGGAPLLISTSIPSEFNFAAVNGFLILVGAGVNNPIYIEYDEDTDTVTQTGITIEVRDVWGVDDSLSVDERPLTLSDFHEYNLKNQGWDNTKIDAFFASQGVYPSNADVWILGKDSSDNFDPTLLVKQDLGTTLSSKGRFIIEAFNRGAERQAATTLTSLPQDRDTGNISTVASFAGRVFYSGVRSNATDTDDNSPNYSGTIFFSQILDNKQKVGWCYQEGDPTAEFNAELVSSDGGTIQIPEAAGIVKIVPLETVLLVFAENGVWLISGGDTGFSATGYGVRKITDVGAVGADAIVSVDGTVIYWARGGIYQLTPDPRSGRLIAQNITERTIQTRYNEIPSVAKIFAKGVFDPASRQVKWLYNDTDAYDGAFRVDGFNKELVLDFVLGAFYILEIKEVTGGPYVAAHITTSDFVTADDVESIVSNAIQVQANLVDVAVTRNVRSRGNSTIKYLTIVPDGVDSWTISSYNNSNFLDWETFDTVGADAAAFLETGYELFGDTQRSKGVRYITTHMLRTESGFLVDGNGDLQYENPSSCLLQARWDFADTVASGKFGTQFEAYRLNRFYLPTGPGDIFDYGQSVITTKTKLRGWGRSLYLRFDTSPGKDLYLYGWGMVAEGNTVV